MNNLSKHLRPYPEYKDSGLPWLGEMPVHWKIKRAKSIFQRIDERSKTGQEELLTVSSMRGVVPRKTATVTMFKAESYLGYKLCWPGDLVINSLWAWAGGLGVSRHHGIISSAYGVYRIRRDAPIIPDFVHEVVRSTPYQWELQVRSKGVWISRLQLTDISFFDAPIFIPPPDEQAAIVKFLDWANGRLERAIRAKRKIIALLNEQKQAIIHRAVTRGLDPNVKLKPSGIPWLGDIPKHWEVRKLKYEMSFRGGGTPSKANAAYWNGSIPWVSPKDMKFEVIHDTEDHISEKAVKESSTNLVPKGSLLMVVRSGILQRTIPVAICSRIVAINQDMKALTGKGQLDLEYLIFLIRGCENRLLKEWTKQGATVESIEHQLLANTRVPVPPLSEQNQIIAHLAIATTPVTSAISHLDREIALLREYRTRLVADVVTGKLDVREAAKRLPDELEPEIAEADDSPESIEADEEADVDLA